MGKGNHDAEPSHPEPFTEAGGGGHVEAPCLFSLDTGKGCVIFKSNMKRGLPRLTQIREAKGYSLRRLANKVGMSYVALFRLERGETDPRLGTLRKLAKALRVGVAELIGEGKPAPKRARRLAT